MSKIEGSKIRNWLIRMKFYISRSSTYLSLINLGMISFLFISNLKDKGYITFDIGKYYIPLIVFSLLLFAFIGWIEVKFFKGYREEARVCLINDPIHSEMRDNLNKLCDKLLNEDK